VELSATTTVPPVTPAARLGSWAVLPRRQRSTGHALEACGPDPDGWAADWAGGNPKVLVPGLVFAGLVVAAVGSLGALLVPTVAGQTHP
jgi:hypothetical protein